MIFLDANISLPFNFINLTSTIPTFHVYKVNPRIKNFRKE